MGKPDIGLVIRHLYLWRHEALQGKEEGRKARPCVIIHRVEHPDGETEVFIAPITHLNPKNKEASLEIPLVTKRRLHLDDEQSWVITNEVNRFIWKGPDVRATPSGGAAYGYLPANLTKAIIRQIKANASSQQLKVVKRSG